MDDFPGGLGRALPAVGSYMAARVMVGKSYENHTKIWQIDPYHDHSANGQPGYRGLPNHFPYEGL